MLSIRNLVKVYKTKGGAEVRALDGVSVDFPKTGMVFLLGKSGSGKSTLLNVAGGLDRPDRGEVIVMGKSSKDFSGSDFDSYRNTYVGFVFQEYNILNEFNVEQNIALALQLQGKKNDKEAVNELLDQVDLTGLGKRKPNTLSGGQKQRVAIARALIKEPEIIMADEPTGALDSNTGKQVFDTLKKLSSEKLVIVVSHDREFAEQYGDRVIELKDGKILSDTTKALAAPTELSSNVNAIGADTVRVKDWNKLTQDDFNQIWSMMKGRNGEVIITSSEADMPAIKRVCKIANDGSKEYFKDTERGDVKVEQYDGSKTKFIKSKMPASRAIKMGASGLKTKPIRLFFTIFIAFLAFGLFGVVSTMMMYDVNYTTAQALIGQTKYKTAALQKIYDYEVHNTYYYHSGGELVASDNSYKGNSATPLSAEDIKKMNDGNSQLKFAGVLGVDPNNYQSLYYRISNMSSSGSGYYENGGFYGFVDAGEQYIFDAFGSDAKIAGSYPVGSDEIAISEYTYEVIKNNGLYDSETELTVTVSDAQSLIGQYITLNNNYNGTTIDNRYKITGIYRTGDLSEFDSLKSDSGQSGDSSEDSLYSRFITAMTCNFHTLAFVSPSFYNANKSQLIKINNNYRNGDGYANDIIYTGMYTSDEYNSRQLDFRFMETIDKSSVDFYSLSGDKIASPAAPKDREVYISLHELAERAFVLSKSTIRNPSGFNQEYRTHNPEFEENLSVLTNCVGSGQIAANFDDALKYVLTSMSADWDECVKGDGTIEGESKALNGDFDKAYLGSENNYLSVVGFYLDSQGFYNTYKICTQNFLSANSNSYSYNSEVQITKYVMPENAIYNMAITPIDMSQESLVNYVTINLGADGSDDSYLRLTGNSLASDAQSAGYMFESMSFVFLIVGAVLAVIASLFMFNFISISIADKRKEIGILRAVGARGSDVFKIFLSESLIIAVICMVLAIIGGGVACFIINMILSRELSFTFLNFGILNALLIVGISLVVSFIATILPVFFAAKKPPVESIRAL